MGDTGMPKKFSTDLTDYSVQHSEKTGPYADNLDVDAIIVGAGFAVPSWLPIQAGIFMLKTLRDRGYNVVVFEAGNDLGGTWRWNCYPGAGVDSEVPEYEFSWPEVWKTWNWSSNYPTYEDLRAYFDHVDKILGIKKDCAFNTVVVGGKFDTQQGKWTIRTEDGRVSQAKNLVLGTGFRTPNLAVPMRRRRLTAADQDARKRAYDELFRYRETCYGGFHYDWIERNTFDDTAAEREAVYERAWREGGFRYWVGLYKDNLIDPDANKESYRFWAKKTRARVGDPAKRELLAPKEMPHFFGVKRPCLESDYYEQFNRENFHLVDVKNNPIERFTKKGIMLKDGTHHEFDVVAVATGFILTTLPTVMTQLGLESITGEKLADQWRDGAKTYLGTTVSGYPNMFHLYGPQGPTLLSNGPSTVEVQGRWIADMMDKMSRGGIRYVNPRPEAADAYKKKIVELNDRTLFPTTRSTYMGGSIPGKVYEPVCWAGGIPAYKQEIRAALDRMDGFEVVKGWVCVL
uniref:Cyclopentanone 1,2-monooxygenase n=1 Tax=Pyricularia oryzae (strain P131) TaxID=1143193 RepID=L7J5P6_PYRO1